MSTLGNWTTDGNGVYRWSGPTLPSDSNSAVVIDANFGVLSGLVGGGGFLPLSGGSMLGTLDLNSNAITFGTGTVLYDDGGGGVLRQAPGIGGPMPILDPNGNVIASGYFFSGAASLTGSGDGSAINVQGPFIFAAGIQPTPVAGGMYFDGGQFWVCADGSDWIPFP